MAKNDASWIQEERRRLAAGEQLSEGVCLDFDRAEPIYRCSEVEQAVARGEVSMSYDGTKILDLATGEMKEGKPIVRTATMTTPGGTPAGDTKQAVQG